MILLVCVVVLLEIDGEASVGLLKRLLVDPTMYFVCDKKKDYVTSS